MKIENIAIMKKLNLILNKYYVAQKLLHITNMTKKIIKISIRKNKLVIEKWVYIIS